MRSQSKQRVFIPLMLMGVLFLGAVSAQAQDYNRRGNRAAKGAAVGAVLGTLVQLIQGRTEGGELLQGAVVGGTLGAVVGANSDGRRGQYDDRYRDGYYDQGEYYSQNDGYQDGYYPDGYDNRNGYYQDGYDSRNDGYTDGGSYSRDSGYRYNHEDRHDRRSSHRHGSRCGRR